MTSVEADRVIGAGDKAALTSAPLSVPRAGFPGSGDWREVFNSDVYDNWVNPIVAGNGQGVVAAGPPMHDMPASAECVLPANSIIIFARPAE